MSTKTAQKQPLSDNNKRWIIIGAIVLAAIIAVSVTLGVMLKPQPVNPDTETPNTTPSSNLPVHNGDFALVDNDSTMFPKTALNWAKYGYSSKTETTRSLQAIDTTENVVMGIVDTADDKWQSVVDDAKAENVNIGANPKQHELTGGDKHPNSNVYMIASKKATNATIVSDSVTVSATSSAKITVWVNTSQLAAGSKATVMILKSSATTSVRDVDMYAYKVDLEAASGWQKCEFYVFNRKSTEYVRVSVGLGNVYENENAEGTLFIDDIAYETVTADKYRQYADNAAEGDTTYKIIEKEEDTTVAQHSGYLPLAVHNATTTIEKQYTHENVDEYIIDAGYSPFTKKDDFFNKGDENDPTGFGIYKISNDGTKTDPIALVLSGDELKMTLAEDDDAMQDHKHISFWVRTTTRNVLANAQILVQRNDNPADPNWVNLDENGFTATTEQDLENDTNNGWTKFDVYLKPAQTPTEIRIVFALGNINGFDNDFIPDGDLYVTTPYYETISNSAYTSASGSAKKYDLTGKTANSTVSNGSFSNVTANAKQPSDWAPAFAGENTIFKDGKGSVLPSDVTVDKTMANVSGSGVERWWIDNGYNKLDDAEGRALAIKNSAATSFGYVSNDITASARTVYVFSVLAKVTAGNVTPHFYLIEGGAERDKAVVGSVENVYEGTAVDGSVFCQADELYANAGWTRYFIVYITGNKDTTVRLALFNGSLDGKTQAAANSAIYYDRVSMQTVGTYSLVKDEDDKDSKTYNVEFTASQGFTAFEECKTVEEFIEKLDSRISYDQPEEPEWTEMKTIVETDDKDDDKDDDDKTDDTEKKRDVNLALLFSILSSVLLVAALGVVLVMKAFKRNRRS